MTKITSSPASVGYLGPEGTFTEQALLSQPDLAAAAHVLCRSHSGVLFRTQEGDVDVGFCAIENSIEGTVNVIQDFNVVTKHQLSVPKQMVGVFACPNSNCITHGEPVDSHYYVRSVKGGIRLKCKYCEKSFSKELITSRV